MKSDIIFKTPYFSDFVYFSYLGSRAYICYATIIEEAFVFDINTIRGDFISEKRFILSYPDHYTKIIEFIKKTLDK